MVKIYILVFWADTMSVVGGYENFRGISYFNLQGTMVKLNRLWYVITQQKAIL
jgi:hypothetical protein